MNDSGSKGFLMPSLARPPGCGQPERVCQRTPGWCAQLGRHPASKHAKPTPKPLTRAKGACHPANGLSEKPNDPLKLDIDFRNQANLHRVTPRGFEAEALRSIENEISMLFNVD